MVVHTKMDDITTLPDPQTNAGFAARAKVHFSMASRLRTGDRAPSIHTLRNAAEGYGLSAAQILDWLAAIDEGPQASGRWIRENIFNETEGLPKTG